MGPLTFAELEYDRKKRRTRRELFLERMEQLIPWETTGRSDRAVLSEGRLRSAAVPAGRDAAGFIACSCSIT